MDIHRICPHCSEELHEEDIKVSAYQGTKLDVGIYCNHCEDTVLFTFVNIDDMVVSDKK